MMTKVDPAQDQGILLWTLVVWWFYIKKCFQLRWRYHLDSS